MADDQKGRNLKTLSERTISLNGLRRMLDVDEVLALIPVSRTTLFRMERDRSFPTSYSISPNRRAWYADEILAWQKALPENRRIRAGCDQNGLYPQ